jgi:hypothetical protein
MESEMANKIKTAADFLTAGECDEVREMGMSPSRIKITVESRSDGPQHMRSYDWVSIEAPASYKKLMSCHQTQFSGAGYGPKVVKGAILGYW